MSKNITKALFFNFIINILIPVMFYLPLIQIVYFTDGMGSQSFYTKLEESFFLYFLVVLSMMSLFYAAVGLGKISIKNYDLFSFRFGSKIYNVSNVGERFYVEENGATGLAMIVINFIKCLIIMPLKVLVGLINMPLILFSDDYCDAIEGAFNKEMSSRFLSIIILVASVLLCLPATFAKKNELEKYNLDNISADYVGLEYEGMNPNGFGGIYRYSIAFSINHGDHFINYYSGKIIIYVDDELITSIDCEYRDNRLYPGGIEINNINGVYVEYSFSLYEDPGNLETISQGNDKKMEIRFTLDEIYYGETEESRAGYEFNEMVGRPGPILILFKNYE